MRLPELQQQRLLVGLGLLDRGDQCRLGTGDDELQRQVEVLDDLLVVGDVARVTHQELTLVTGLGGGEQLGQVGDP